MEWINVKKYNPPFDVGVLAVIKHAEHIGAIEIQVCRLDDDSGQWVLENTYEDKRDHMTVSSIGAEVIYWAELPKIPKEIKYE